MLGSLKLVTPAAAMPVTLERARGHLRLDVDDEPDTDNYVTALINAAAAHIEGVRGITGRALITQTWSLSFDQAPEGVVRIPLPPLQSVASVKYLDSDGVEQTIDAADYSVDTDSEPGRVKPDGRWPTTGDHLSAFTVQFTAGYGDSADDIPEPIQQSILLMVGHWYANREDVVVGTVANRLPIASEALLTNYRVWF